MQKFFKLAAIAAVAVCSLQARADLVIDTFSTAQSATDNSMLDGAISTSMALPAADSSLTPVVTRTLIAEKVGLAGPANEGSGVDIRVLSGSQRLAFSQDADQFGTGTASWEGATPLTSILDLTTLSPTSAFNFTYRADGALDVEITLTDTTGASITQGFSTIDTNGGFFADSIAVADFNLLGLGSTDIYKISIVFNVGADAGTADIDLTLTQIVNRTPEPASLALAGLGLLAFGATRRRARAKQL